MNLADAFRSPSVADMIDVYADDRSSSKSFNAGPTRLSRLKTAGRRYKTIDHSQQRAAQVGTPNVYHSTCSCGQLIAHSTQAIAELAQNADLQCRECQKEQKKESIIEEFLDNAPAFTVSSFPDDALLGVVSPRKELLIMVTLTLKGLNKRGNKAIFIGGIRPLQFPLTSFKDKTAPQTLVIEAENDAFLAHIAKVKLTKEQRAALPKLTLAEKIAKREASLEALKKRAAADAAKSAPATEM